MPTVITKTVKSAGGDYSSRSAAEAGIQTLYSSNFVTADVQVDVESYNFSDTTALTIDGTTTDATRFWRWKAAAGNRHAGTWSTSAARLVVNGSFAAAATGSDDFTRFEGEQIQNTADRANNARVAEVSSIASGADVQFIGCILRGSGTGVATAVSAGIRAVLAAGNVLRVRNCLIYDNGEGIIDPSGNSNVETDLYNNIIVDNSRNGIKFDNSNHTRRWKNNLSVFNTTADYAISGSGTNDYATNVSSDATSPDVGGRSKTPTFVNRASDDYHLASSDTAAKDAGTDLSADATWPFSDDIDGVARSGTWDVGADEYVASGTAYTTNLTATIAPAGALAKAASAPKAGSATPAGTLRRATAAAKAASISPAGSIAKAVSEAKTGAIVAAGSVAKATSIARVGSVTPAGALQRTTAKALSGAIALAGSLQKAIGKALRGLLTWVGSLLTSGGATPDPLTGTRCAFTPFDERTTFTPDASQTTFTPYASRTTFTPYDGSETFTPDP
jgi:hypothetical protein